MLFWLAPLAISWLGTSSLAAHAPPGRQNVSRPMVNFAPHDPFAYMVDNTYNTHGVAPDKGTQNGSVWLHSGSFENFMKGGNRSYHTLPGTNDTSNYVHNIAFDAGGSFFISNTTNASDISTSLATGPQSNSTISRKSQAMKARADSDYWLPTLAPLGSQPLASSGYQFYRDVTDTAFGGGAKGDGQHDDTEAINAAISAGSRCGLECGNTFTQGAIIYFPHGTYRICRPIIQLYYTQFIGDPNNRPTILGCETFSGIALVDTDPYIPGGSGSEWYVNQNQFFRQIRNFIFDLTKMPSTTDDAGQPLVPTGIHWQVAQAASLQNLQFKMPTDTGSGTQVGIFMENGSGGFVSDLEFIGGAIGWRAGNQQYTARNLKFSGCTQAVQMIWDWGFNWQQVQIDGGTIGFNISAKGGITNQGVGSVSLIDCKITNVPTAILTYAGNDAPPNLVIDNLVTSNVQTIVQTSDGKVLLGAAGTVGHWAIGQRYVGGEGNYQSGMVGGVPAKAASLMNGGSFFARSRPQYESLGVSSFLVATAHNILNDGTGNQVDAINSFLSTAASQGLVAYFPAGIYQVQNTVKVPLGSKIQGSSWSQIMGTGSYFGDIKKPKVMVQVGQPGDSGIVEIVEMLFTVKGPTAGAILMEWNVHESTQGSAGMWDSHFRVGGATGSELTINECPKLAYNENCIAASLLFHVTSKASGYFENVWVWTADHDNDMNMYDEFDPTANQISVYTGRGTLIESEGPSWFIGSGSEHSALYQYQLYNAKDIYLGHIQTETPYYQPDPVGPKPFDVISNPSFPSDPTFDDCNTDTCRDAWAVRIIDSSNIYIHSAGTYSFFQNYDQTCVGTFDCQQRLVQVRGSTDVVIFNMFTVGSVQVGTGVANTFIKQVDTQSGFTSEVSVWLPLAGDDDYEIIYIGTEVFTTHTAAGTAPCIFVLPPSSIPTTTITLPSYVTSLEVGSGVGTTTTITLHLDPITTDYIGWSNVNVTNGQPTGYGFVPSPSINVPPATVPVTGPDGHTTSRTIDFPPWPAITNGPPQGWNSSSGPWAPTLTGAQVGAVNGTLSIPFITPATVTVKATKSTITTVKFPPTVSPITVSCPPSSVYSFQTPATAVTIPCPGVTTIAFSCPTTKVVTITAPTTIQVTVDCTTVIGVAVPTTTTPTTTPLPTWTTWPPGAIYPITTSVDKPKPTGDHSETPCHLWFFWICISWKDINIQGWEWVLPPGIYPPGPPPFPIIHPPPGWKIEGSLPPWPRFTIGPDLVPTYPSDPQEPCQTQTASICSTTTSITTIINAGTTKTSSSTSSTCTPIYGCEAQDTNTGTQTATCTSLNKIRRRAPATAAPTPTTLVNVPRSGASSCDEFGSDSIVYPANPKDQNAIQQIRDKLSVEADVTEVKSDTLGFTAFWWVGELGDNLAEELRGMAGVVGEVYAYEYYQGNNPDPDINEGSTNHTEELIKRTSPTQQKSNFWELSQISTPKKGDWYGDERIRQDVIINGEPTIDYSYYYDASSGADQYVYLTEDGIWDTHPEFVGALIEHIPGGSYGDLAFTADLEHGSGAGSKVIGRNLGIVKSATMVVLDKKMNEEGVVNTKTMVREKYLESLLNAADDISKKGRSGKSVVSISWGLRRIFHPPAFFDIMLAILQELDALDTAVVALSHNYARTLGLEIQHYPAKFLGDGDFPNLIVVGSTNGDARRAGSSMESDWMTTYAPGENVNLPATSSGGYRVDSGTSFAAPLVAGLVAYYRALPLQGQWNEQLQKPSAVKALITHFDRRLVIDDPSVPPDVSGEQDRKPVIWNGQVFDKSCLLDRPFTGDAICGDALPADLGSLSPNGGESVSGNGDGSDFPAGQNAGPIGSTITFQSGEPSPTCTTHCGTLCTGYYCTPNPTGVPPDFTDPINNPSETLPTNLPSLTTAPTPTGSCVASGAVTTCAAGPGGQSACITTTKCTSYASPTTATPTTTPPAPSPTPQNAFIIIALEELLITNQEGGDWDRWWDVFAAPLNGKIDTCSDSNVFQQVTTSANGADPGFPPTLGPFKADGFSCTYKGDVDSLGLLVCDGVANMWCEHLSKATDGCGLLDNPTMTAVVLCRW